MPFVFFGIVTSANAGEISFPSEVRDFILERELCDHFRGEPHEGNHPEQIKRREFIYESLEKYCNGTDSRLAALKKKYKNSRGIMQHLGKYEENVEHSSHGGLYENKEK